MTEPLKVGTQVQTRDGRPARIICDDRIAPYKAIVALVAEVCDGYPEDRIAVYSADGTSGHFVETGTPAPDLIRKPRQRDVWLVVLDGFFEPSGRHVGAFVSKADALHFLKGRTRAGLVRVTVTEGQYEPASQEGE